MNREHILEAIRKNKPAETEAPPPFQYLHSEDDIETVFMASLEKAGGRIERIAHVGEAAEKCKQYFQTHQRIVDFVNPDMQQNTQWLEDPANIDLTILKGRLGVAENGAIWLQESDCVHRSLPFITHHLALVLDRSQLVNTMHEAYARINTREEGFGVFIAGPSKTADIEQSLVIGAHGAKSLLVLLVG